MASQSNSQQSQQPQQSSQGTPNEGGNSNSVPSSGDTVKSTKRKPIKPRSKMWDHFTKFTDESGNIKGKCNYCSKEFCCDPKRNGTSALNNHLSSCQKSPQNVDNTQKQLCLQPMGEGDMGSLSNWKFDQMEIREAIAEMVIEDECPFKVVESKGFKKVMFKACPRFKVPSRWTVSRDCFQIYVNEKAKLKSFIKKNSQRICLTTDTWTSIQKMNYMCITGHFIDNDWKLHKKILNFCPISSHTGDSLGKVLVDCLLEWGIENVFTVTVDNHSANEVACNFLKKKLVNWKTCIAHGKYLHMRCIAHIMNLIVQDGLKEVRCSTKWIRNAVRYVRNSPARIKKFKECAEDSNIQCKNSLKLDVPTRWNSTYEMLSVAEKYEKAFEKFEMLDPYFKLEVEAQDNDGIPFVDWATVRRLSGMLQFFYDATMRISGSLYVTSNTFWTEISDLVGSILKWTYSDDLEIRAMGLRMKEKFDKYWGDHDKVNKLIYIAHVFDPREKFEAMEFAFCKIHSVDDGKKLFKGVKDTLFELFNEYKCMVQPESGHSSFSQSSRSPSSNVEFSDSSVGIKRRLKGVFREEFKRQKENEGFLEMRKTELDIYLEEALQEDREDFDILRWWRVNSERFPILAHMARDILAVPVSTVASESAFSTGGRVLDSFRSSLTPKVVEGLICAQDWLRNGIELKNEEDLEEIERHENELPIVGFGGNGAALSSSTPSSGVGL